MVFGDLRGSYFEHADTTLLRSLMMGISEEECILERTIERCYKDVLNILETKVNFREQVERARDRMKRHQG